uniref:Uncharacterized protein n=1 Tax=Anopheles albimanus TaxID=7167 RepID=A0A182F2F9_ANOAL
MSIPMGCSINGLSSRQDTASPSDTACSSESPAFLGPPASAAHLLLYDQNSSEEELEVINGGAGAVGNCDIIEVGSVSGVPSRIGAGPAGLCGRVAGIDQLPMMSDGADEEDDEEEDDATEEIIDEGEDDEDDDDEEDEEVASAIASATTATTVTTVKPKVATTIIGSAGRRPMDTSVRGHFVSLAAGGAIGGLDDVFADGESLDDFADELCLASSSDDAPMAFNGMLNVKTVSSSGKQHQHQPQHQQQQRFSTLLEKRKRSLAQNSDDEVRFLLEQQQQTPLHQAHHPNHHLHHPHHQHHSLRHHQQQQQQSKQHHQQQQQQQQQQHLHQQHQLLQQEQLTEESLLSAPVNFRTSPPLEALKPHRGHILQRSTTPLILTESGSHGGSGSGLLLPGSGSGSLLSSTTSSLSSLLSGCGSSASTGGGSSGFYEPGLAGGGGIESQQQQRSSAVSAPASSASSNLVTNMDVSRSVSPPAKMFHCAVSPRRRAPRHQQQRLQRPHRPCLDFDKMQQLKARSVTTWRHSNEHSGELSVFCW